MHDIRIVRVEGAIVDGVFARVRALRDRGQELDGDRVREGLEIGKGGLTARECGIQLVQIGLVGRLLRRIHLSEEYLCD